MRDHGVPARLAIEAQYARLSEAVRNKDLDAIRALHTPDYKERQISGEERDLAETMAEWRDDLAAMIEPDVQTEVHRFDLDSDQATLTLGSVQTFIASPSGSLRFRNRIETTRRDDWTSTDAGWRLRRSERQAIKWWIDDQLHREMKFSPPLTADQRAAVVRELRSHVIAFNSVLAGNRFDDLAGLDRLIGDARIVALGEATHGTAEFFQMKHRLVEYLVEKKGFTVFAIEGNWPEAKAADRFVKSGEGAAGAALAAMYFWTWQTEEISALLQWMHHYNATRGERPVLSFTGFDMQYPAVAMKHVLDFLDRTVSADRDVVRAHYDGMETLDKPHSEIPPQQYIRLAAGARKALDLIDAHREMLATASTPEAYRDLRQAARIACQALEMRAGILERDRAMAENVCWLIEQAFPGQKFVLWAHDRHVGTNLGGAERSLGDHLRDRYGDQMAIIGFASHHGAVRAIRIKDGSVQRGGPVALPLAPASPFSIEAVFEETGLPRFILDLRDLPKDSAVRAWLAEPRLQREMGAVYDPDRAAAYYEYTRLPAMYDGIVFIAESTAARPLK